MEGGEDREQIVGGHGSQMLSSTVGDYSGLVAGRVAGRVEMPASRGGDEKVLISRSRSEPTSQAGVSSGWIGYDTHSGQGLSLAMHSDDAGSAVERDSAAHQDRQMIGIPIFREDIIQYCRDFRVMG